MKKIKIAQVITRMDWGGSPDVVRILSDNLDRERYDLFFICGRTVHPSRKTKSFFEKLGSRLIKIDSLRRDINPFFDITAFFSLCSVFIKYRFDIVHTHTAKAGALARIAGFFCGVKVIVHTSHGNNFYGYFNPLMSWVIVFAERMLSLFTKRMIAFTELEKKDLLRFRICAAEKVEVIDTVVDIGPDDIQLNAVDVRRNLGVPDGSFIIGMTARLEPIKGIKDFIEAAVITAGKYPEVCFLIVGKGSLKGFIEEQIAAQGLESRFFLVGWQEYPLNYIQAMDVLVLASLNEAVGIVLIEAQKLGVPVIATQVGGIPEIVDDGKTGLLVKPSDPEMLSQAMDKFISDNQMIADLKKNIEEYKAVKYAPDTFIKNIETIYGRLGGVSK